MLATSHLLGLGHRHVAFLGGPPATRSGEQRFVGFEAAHAAAGLTSRRDLIVRGPFAALFGVEGVAALLAADPPPTGLVIANHEAMFSALQALNRAGVGIPAGLSVVAIEDDPLLAWWHPAITSVDVRPVDLAAQAVAALLQQIRGEVPAERPVPADVILLERASTARLD